MSVSICIPTFKGEAYIAETIQSVIDQSYQEIEIIVLDDAASADTEAICKSFEDDRVLYFANSQRLGPKGNWDKCIKMAAGTYFKLLPHDDILLPRALERQSHILQTRQDVALVFGARQILNPNGSPMMERKPLGDMARSIDGFELVRKTIRTGNNIIGEPGNGLIRTELAKHLAHYDDSYPYTIDLNFWFRALAFGNAYYTAEFESAFRVHNESWSAELARSQYHDFVATAETFAKDPVYAIDRKTLRIGRYKAKFNTYARRVIFKLNAKS